MDLCPLTCSEFRKISFWTYESLQNFATIFLRQVIDSFQGSYLHKNNVNTDKKNTKYTTTSPREYFFFYWRYNPLWVCILHPSSGAVASSRTRFLDHTQRPATVGRTPLDEWSVRRRDLYLTTHNTHNRQTSMPPVGFEPTISAGERP